jgi:hypothetical protein
MSFIKYQKIPRYSQTAIITEKLDGTSGKITILDKWEYIDVFGLNFLNDKDKNPFILGEKGDLCILAGSRENWLSLEADNFGFAGWVYAFREELFQLGKGNHFGAWIGCKIQRNYGLKTRQFHLFNVNKWKKGSQINPLQEPEKLTECPDCCELIPILSVGNFSDQLIKETMDQLKKNGSSINNFKNPEGIVIAHGNGNLFKKTFENDEGKHGKKDK